MQLSKVLILILWSWITFEVIHGQNINYIKSNPGEYYWSEAEGETIDEATTHAITELAKSIELKVSTESQTIDDSEIKGDNSSFNTKRHSETTLKTNLTLTNVHKLVLSESPAKVFCYISIEDLKKIYEKQKDRVRQYVNAGKIAEKRLQIDDALYNYYWALVMASFYDQAVEVEFGEDKGDCRTIIPIKIKSIISAVTATATETSKNEYGAYPILVNFEYAGNPLSTITYHYHNGEYYVGPVTAHDGIGEVEVLKIPNDGKIQLRYEYRFDHNMDNEDLKKAFEDKEKLPTFVTTKDLFVKENKRKEIITAEKETNSVASAALEVAKIAPEPIKKVKRISLETPADSLRYIQFMSKVEEAINKQKPTIAKELFSPEGYLMFENLFRKTTSVKILGEPKYKIIDDGLGQILVRPCKLQISYGAKRYTENIVFRFDKRDDKICSLAFMLTQVAEQDIFNSKAKWSNISRFTILEFMEDYQTAYAQKNLEYIKQIFSDRAVIILGTVLKPLQDRAASLEDGQIIHLGASRPNIRYSKFTKEQYIKRLESQFEDRDYIHLKFEDNSAGVINSQRIKEGDAFYVQIRQIYESPGYSDKGYLTLMLNMQGEKPMIEVRLWQPEKDHENKVSVIDFFTEKNFKL